MLNNDFQKLSVLGVVTLYELDATHLGAGILRWHGHVGYEDWLKIYDSVGDPLPADSNAIEYKQDIIWQGNTYRPQAIVVEGVESRGDGKASMPTLSMANIVDGIAGGVSALCAHYEDFVGAKVTIITTLAKYLDAANFKNGNPNALNEYERTTWFVEQKTSESVDAVVFELSNPVDFEGMKIPCREITNYCHWAVCGRYRGEECGYIGAARFTKDGKPTDNPELDQCGGTLSDCRLRFGDSPMSFGGFPAASLLGD